MRKNIVKYLEEQPILKILKVFCYTEKSYHLRELVRRCELSPSGASHILRRLCKLGLLKGHKEKNRIKYSLILNPDEALFLRELFLRMESEKLQNRAQKIESRAVARFEWMDQTLVFYKKVKERKRDTTKSA